MRDTGTQVQTAVRADIKEDACQANEVERVDYPDRDPPLDRNNDPELEPELHARTWVAIAAFFLLNYTQVVALQGPTAVVSLPFQGLRAVSRTTLRRAGAD